jgi:hypothetical protein
MKLTHKLAISLAAMTFAALPQMASAQNSCNANFNITNASDGHAVATVYSRTRANLTWNPNRKMLNRDEGLKLVGVAAGVATGAATAAATGATAGAASPSLLLVPVASTAAVGLTALGYDVRDRRLGERTVNLPPKASGTVPITFPFGCGMKRQILVDVTCRDGNRMTYDAGNTPDFEYSDRRQYSLRVCAGR